MRSRNKVQRVSPTPAVPAKHAFPLSYRFNPPFQKAFTSITDHKPSPRSGAAHTKNGHGYTTPAKSPLQDRHGIRCNDNWAHENRPFGPAFCTVISAPMPNTHLLYIKFTFIIRAPSSVVNRARRIWQKSRALHRPLTNLVILRDSARGRMRSPIAPNFVTTP